MRQVLLLAFALLSPCATSLRADDWAERLFEERRHDFGRVPFGARAEHAFTVTNVHPFEVEISRTRVSCECTDPVVGKSLLRPGERTTVKASLATTKYHGRKGATITVTFSKPSFAEVQLHVTSFIDKQVEVEPASIELGTVEEGAGAERQIVVRALGKPDWRIVEVRCDEPHLSGKAVQTARNEEQVSYAVTVRLEASAPGGRLERALVLVTNDEETPEIPVLVHGRVLSELEVSPAVLFMGVAAPAARLSKVIVVRGRRPFRLLSVDSDLDGLSLPGTSAGTAKALYVIPVSYQAGRRPGKVSGTIRVKTDLGKAPSEIPVQAVVRETP